MTDGADHPRWYARGGWWTAIALAVLAYVPALTAAPGRMPADSKLYLYLDPTKFINDALVANKDLVDAMDEEILSDVYTDLDKCIAAAATENRKISGKALLYAAMWINMSGHPTKLLTWLKGGDPHLHHPVPKAPALVGGADIRAYLMATDYYVSNPGNAPHLDTSVQAGAGLLPPGA